MLQSSGKSLSTLWKLQRIVTLTIVVDCYSAHCVKGDPHLKRHAITLLQTPLCPVFETAGGTVVLSVPPLSNGYESRTTADCAGAVLLECSSAINEATCRAMLISLLTSTIEMLETEGCAARILVEPVQVVCSWNPWRVLNTFPSHDELNALPAVRDSNITCGDDASDSEEGSWSDDSDSWQNLVK